MAGSGILKKDWIDANLPYLVTRLGSFPLFEPSGTFYDSLGGLGDQDTGEGRREISGIFSHLGVPEIPVRFVDGMSHPGEFRFSTSNSLFPTFSPGMIAISSTYRGIPDARKRGMAIGAILSHEITHYCLLGKSIIRDFSPDNEELTDLGTIVLGLGKLHFNGRDSILGERHEQVGYLSLESMVYAFMEYQRGSGISPDIICRNLEPGAQSRILECQARVTREVEELTRRERAERHEAERESLRADLLALHGRHYQAKADLGKVAGSLTLAKRNQEIINRTPAFWEIGAGDNRVIGEFVGALFLAVHDADLDRIGRELDILERDIGQLAGTMLKEAATGGSRPGERQAIGKLTAAITLQANRTAGLNGKISTVLSAQERGFSGIAMVRKDLAETIALVDRCREMKERIGSHHRFFGENPAVWYRYGNDRDLTTRIAGLLGGGGPEASLSLARGEAEQLDRFLSSWRENYPEMVSRFSSIRDLARVVRSRQGGVAETLRTLQGVLASLETITGEYQEGARLFGNRLEGIRATFQEDREAVALLRPRWELISRKKPPSGFPTEPERQISEILEAVTSADGEARAIHAMHVIEGLGTAVRCDAERARLLSESERITPMEAYWKDFGHRAEELEMLHARVSGWKGTEERYAARIRAMERVSRISSLGEMSRRIRSSLHGFGGRWEKGKP